MVLKRAKQKGISFGYCDINTGQRVVSSMPDDLSFEQEPPVQQARFSPELTRNNDVDPEIATWPPLGQATQVARTEETVGFVVLLESSSASSSGASQPEASLWLNHNGPHEWSEIPLERTVAPQSAFLVSHRPDRNPRRTWFTTQLSGLPKHAHVVRFTVKFRFRSDEDWHWVKDLSGIADGELHYQSHDFEKHSSCELSNIFSNISSDIKVQSERPDTRATLLYSLTCPVHPAHGEHSGYQHHQLGHVNHGSRWFSLVRLWSPWLAPRQGRGKFELDKDGVLVSFLRTDGMHVVCLAISGIEDVLTTFLNDEQGNIIIKGRNDRQEIGTSRVLIAVADNFEVANAAVFYHARKVVGTYESLSSESETQKLLDTNVKPQWLEEWYDGLTYCTWNGLGQNLTEDKIHNALDELSKQEINITNLIIDDNWQSITSGDTQFQRGWTDFEANPNAFPDGLKATTAAIRKRHPNVNHIAVWHALLGYWGGIAPDGNIAKKYRTIEVEKEPGTAGGTFTVVAGEDAKRMYDDFYSFLSASGIDAVKTDAQCFLDFLLHAPDRRALTTEYQDSWSLAHLRHFSSRAISCMSQSPQILFHSQLPVNKPRLLVRNSDDFFPEIEASHPWHIFCNAYNSIFALHLNVLPDWDMFQTSHSWAAFHAAARCVSGGPIYFTDEPGKHDLALIRQMTAQTPRGKTVILRPSVVGRAMDPYNSYDAQALLKIGTYVGMARTGSSVLGVFNVTSRRISELVHLDGFLGTEDGDYVVSSFASRSVSEPMNRRDRKAVIGMQLEKKGWDILTAHPLRNFTLPSPKPSLSVAMMGLLDKMTGTAAITGYDMYVETNGRLRVWVSLKALGRLGLYVSDLPKRSIADDLMVMISGKPIPESCVTKGESGMSKVLEIDVERAWKESGEDSGWSNEVSIEIFMG